MQTPLSIFIVVTKLFFLKFYPKLSSNKLNLSWTACSSCTELQQDNSVTQLITLIVINLFTPELQLIMSCFQQPKLRYLYIISTALYKVIAILFKSLFNGATHFVNSHEIKRAPLKRLTNFIQHFLTLSETSTYNLSFTQ